MLRVCVTAIDGVGFTITVGVVGEMDVFTADGVVVCVVKAFAVEL